MKDEILSLEHIHKADHGHLLLKDISFNLFSAEAMCVMIQDFDTKRLLLDILSGSVPSDAGTIYINGMPHSLSSMQHAQKLGIFYIPQQSTMISSMSIAQNFYLTNPAFYKLGLFSERKMIRSLQDVLKTFGLERLNPASKPALLSSADIYLLEIIKAAHSGAKILLMDDIATEHSLPSSKELLRVLTLLREQGVSIIYFTNKYNYLFSFFNSVTIIRSGLTTGLMRPCALTRDQLLLYFTSQYHGRSTSADSATVADETILRAENISVPYHSQIRNFNFSIKKGECLGIWDADWNYSNTLSNTLFGAAPYHGHYYLNEVPLRIRSKRDAVKMGISLISLSDISKNFYPDLNIYENITMLVHKEICSPLGIVNKQLQTYLTRYSLSLIQAEDLLDHYTFHNNLRSIDFCTQMKIIVAKWLCIHPRLIIFIHPYTHFDDLTIHEFETTVSHLLKLGIAVLIPSMNKEYLDRMCTRIITLP